MMKVEIYKSQANICTRIPRHIKYAYRYVYIYMFLYIHVYIYIYMYIYTYVYIYIYIYIGVICIVRDVYICILDIYTHVCVYRVYV